MSVCEKCGSGGVENYLCFSCVRGLRRLLVELGEFVAELETQITRQNVGEKTLGGGGGEAPLLFDERASETLDLVVETLSAWARELRVCGVAVDAGALADGGVRLERARWLVAYLCGNVACVARVPDAGRVFGELGYLVGKCRGAVDRRPPRVLLGVCGCGRQVSADARARVRVCECGAGWDVQATRDRLVELGRDQWVSPREAEELGEVLPGQRLRASTIRSWCKRGRVQADGLGRYRFGDLLNLLGGGG